MDLATLDTKTVADAGAALQLTHPKTGEVLRQPLPADAPPDGEGRPITITVAGQDSERYRKARNAQVTKRLSRRTPGKVTGEDADAEGLDVAVACTVSWDGIMESGEVLPCTAANVRRIYTKYGWIREQVEAFLHDRANFLQD